MPAPKQATKKLRDMAQHSNAQFNKAARALKTANEALTEENGALVEENRSLKDQLKRIQASQRPGPVSSIAQPQFYPFHLFSQEPTVQTDVINRTVSNEFASFDDDAQGFGNF
jgi:hypothetical protein